MTGTETKGNPNSKAKEREDAKQDLKPQDHSSQKREAWADAPSHPVANQGAPGGTSDDDGDSDNQQDPTRRASAPSGSGRT